MDLYKKLLEEKEKIGEGPVTQSLTEHLKARPSKGNAYRLASIRRKRTSQVT